jgi:hypothetical protein
MKYMNKLPIKIGVAGKKKKKELQNCYITENSKGDTQRRTRLHKTITLQLILK